MRRRQRSAFTLVEILVVVGTSAILIGLLLPVMGRARESSYRVACAKNMQQAGVAILMYINDNKGTFPVPSKVLPGPSDAIWWQANRIDDIGRQGIGPYLRVSPSELRIFRCPTDTEAATRQTTGKYPLTYSFNSNMGGDGLQPVKRLSQIRVPAEKIYIIEENGPTLNDASADLWVRTGQWAAAGMLGLRHDRVNRRRYPDAATTAGGIVNPQGRANVMFVDFHVDYMPREQTHVKRRSLPNPENAAFAAEPERGP
jgi:prepilin-type processing-associated H-X9-DG protein